MNETSAQSTGVTKLLRQHRASWAFVGLLALFMLVFSLGIGERYLYGHQGWAAARRSVVRYAWPRVAREIESLYVELLRQRC